MALMFHSFWPLMIAGLLFSAGDLQAPPEVVPTNLKLISAMPSGTESVRVEKYGLLAGADSVMKAHFIQQASSLGVNQFGSQNAPLTIILRQIGKSKPLIHAEGGAKFTAPTGIGAGNYDGRAIWITEQPITPIIQRLSDQKEVEGVVKPLSIDKVRGFEFPIQVPTNVSGGDPVPVTEARFVAFPNDRTTVITESREDLDQMLMRLGSKESKMPRQWELCAEGLDIEAPIVILRRYDRKNDQDLLSPVNSRCSGGETIDVDAIGVTLRSVAHARLQFRCIGRETERAMAFFAESGFFHDFKVDSLSEPNRVTATIEAIKDQRKEPTMLLTLAFLYGINFFI